MEEFFISLAIFGIGICFGYIVAQEKILDVFKKEREKKS